MDLNCKDFRSREVFGGESMIRYGVESKGVGHVGHIYFITDKNGVGYLEWCKGELRRAWRENISRRLV